MRRTCSRSDNTSLVQPRIEARAHLRPLEPVGLSHQLQDGKMSLPPQVGSQAGPQTGQSIVQVHEDMDQRIQHPGEDG